MNLENLDAPYWKLKCEAIRRNICVYRDQECQSSHITLICKFNIHFMKIEIIIGYMYSSCAISLYINDLKIFNKLYVFDVFSIHKHFNAFQVYQWKSRNLLKNLDALFVNKVLIEDKTRKKNSFQNKEQKIK